MKKLMIMIAVIGMMAVSTNSNAGNGIGKEKRTGKQTSVSIQKKTVKAGKKQMKGLKKASKTVNARLSQQAAKSN